MNKTLLSSAVAVGVFLGIAGTPPSALAGGSHTSTSFGVSAYGGYGSSVGYRHGYYGRSWHGGRRNYYGHYHHHHGTGDALLGAMIGLLAFGAIASATDHDNGPSYDYVAPPPPNYGPSGYPAPGNGCHVVNRIGPDRTGQTAKFAATMCYDGSGTPFIVQGSQHIIERY